MGVSYCATCDGAFFKGRTVAVIGGGDAAAEDAIYLAKGCEHVYVIHRRNTMRAAAILQDQLKGCENVTFLWDTEITRIVGEEHVEGLWMKHVKTGEERMLDLDGVFIAVGMTPETEIVSKLLQTDETGYIVAGEDTATSQPGIFAAGDIRTKALRQIITAAADGANAAIAAQKYLMA